MRQLLGCALCAFGRHQWFQMLRYRWDDDAIRPDHYLRCLRCNLTERVTVQISKEAGQVAHG